MKFKIIMSVALLVLAAGCGNSLNEYESALVGTYEVTENGVTVVFDFRDDKTLAMDLDNDGTYDGTSPWEADESTISLEGDESSYTLDGDTLTITVGDEDPMVLVRK